MSHGDGKRERGIRARKAERERRRDEWKRAKREKTPVPPKPDADPVREGVMRAVDAVAAAGGVVLVGHNGHAFAFYPPRVVPDPGAAERLREAVGEVE